MIINTGWDCYSKKQLSEEEVKEVTHSEAVAYLEDLEDALRRAETSYKDRDLLVALRAVYLLMREKVREGCSEKKSGS